MIALPRARSKNKKGRGLPLTGELGALIERRWQARRVGDSLSPWVFHRAGRPVKNFYPAWHGACRRAGLAGRLPHDFRRTTVRDLVRAGVPKSIAKDRTGHVSDSVFDRYDIVDLRDQVDAAEKLEAHRAAVSGKVTPLKTDTTRTIGAGSE